MRRISLSPRIARLARHLAAVGGVLTVMLAYSAPAFASAGQTINTIRAWDGSSYVSQFGYGPNATDTFGQTITPQADSPRLQSFTFVVLLDPSVKFRGYVYRWDPVAQRAKGVARWSSVPRHTTDYTWQRITLDTGGLVLAAGKQYVIFLSVSGLQQAPAPRQGLFAQVGEDLYQSGAFVFFNNTKRSQWTTETWDGGDGDFLCPSCDLAFKAVLST